MLKPIVKENTASRYFISIIDSAGVERYCYTINANNGQSITGSDRSIAHKIAKWCARYYGHLYK